MSLHPLAPALTEGLFALNLTLTEAQQAQLLAYLDRLAKWNRVYNLTALREPGEMLTHHLLDSLAMIAPLRRHSAGRPLRVLDVGSGGGLPGVVVAVCCPELQVDCVDTVGKKAAFIQQVAGALGLANLRGVHARVESLTQRYDIVVSRAFASLHDFTTWSRQTLGEQGVWLAMKGKLPTGELAALPTDVTAFHVEPLTVPGLDAERCLVWLRPAVPTA